MIMIKYFQKNFFIYISKVNLRFMNDRLNKTNQLQGTPSSLAVRACLTKLCKAVESLDVAEQNLCPAHVKPYVTSAYDEERRVTKPMSPLKSCRSRTEFLHSRSRSIAVAPDTMCRAFFYRDYFLHPRATALERKRDCRNPVCERQLRSGDVGFVTWRSSSYI